MAEERMRQKLQDVNTAAQKALSPIQDHVNFTLQQAYFKCAYECFERRRQQEEINRCVEHCSVPVVSAQHRVESEMANFQEKLNRRLMVCQDKYETAKSVAVLESCVEDTIQEAIATLPFLAHKLKASFQLST